MTPPDSGEREVQCRVCLHWHRGDPDSGCYRIGYERLAARVSLPLSLAQRILAALSAIHDAGYQALAAELRERVPK